MESLSVLVDGKHAGRLRSLRSGLVTFEYEPDYPAAATPLSVSMPKCPGAMAATAWIEGAVPGTRHIRSRWQQFLASQTTEPYDLLATMAGFDCSGSVQFVPSRLDVVEAGALESVTESQIASMLRSWEEPHPRLAATHPMMLVSGTQPKFALRLEGREWMVARGGAASTHIFKPPRANVSMHARDSVAVNEMVCLSAIRSLGLPTVEIRLRRFRGVPCLVAKRFDRYCSSDGHLRRIHAEDIAQAMGVPPRLRHVRHGGPHLGRIIKVIRRCASEHDAVTFFKSTFLAWLLGASEVHTKSYSLLLSGTAVRLAPIHGMRSQAPYAAADNNLLMTAFPPSGSARREPAGIDDWAAGADDLALVVSSDELRVFRTELPDAISDAVRRCPEWAMRQARETADSIIAYACSVAPPRRSGPRTTGTDSSGNEQCPKNVKRTRRQCVLRADHDGRCRSVR